VPIWLVEVVAWIGGKLDDLAQRILIAIAICGQSSSATVREDPATLISTLQVRM
jgi:hypothetical protein